MCKITGNFEVALQKLITSLIDSKLETKKSASELAFKLLSEWDRNRGTDWYTSTKKQDEATHASE